MPPSAPDLSAIARKRWQVSLALTGVMLVIYFGFIALIAFAKDSLATLLVPGLSVGILLGALVIAAAWLLTWRYVRWANGAHDSAIAEWRR
jgi:uncharacterized membrane protein (DUF485 family)